jgi:hypothetical protein
MKIVGHPPEREQAKIENAPTLHLSAEQNREPRHSIARPVGEIEPVQGIWSPTIDPDVSGNTPEFANPSVPNPASAHDPLPAAALIWAHRDATSMVYVPFLERLPLGPQDAFARCVDEARPDVLI